MKTTIKILFFATVSVLCFYLSVMFELESFYTMIISGFTGIIAFAYFLAEDYGNNNPRTFCKLIVNFLIIVFLISALIIINNNRPSNRVNNVRIRVSEYNYRIRVKEGEKWHRKTFRVPQYYFTPEESTFDRVLDILDRLD